MYILHNIYSINMVTRVAGHRRKVSSLHRRLSLRIIWLRSIQAKVPVKIT